MDKFFGVVHSQFRHSGRLKADPMGAHALYLYKGKRDAFYRVPSTNQPSSIGQSVSNGCIRMLNEHLENLYDRVPLGTQEVVI